MEESSSIKYLSVTYEVSEKTVDVLGTAKRK
jgi:hypothetical protein